MLIGPSQNLDDDIYETHAIVQPALVCVEQSHRYYSDHPATVGGVRRLDTHSVGDIHTPVLPRVHRHRVQTKNQYTVDSDTAAVPVDVVVVVSRRNVFLFSFLISAPS